MEEDLITSECVRAEPAAGFDLVFGIGHKSAGKGREASELLAL